MAELKTVEIICMPCHKCDVMKEKIKSVLTAIGNQNRMRMRCEFIYYNTRKEALVRLSKLGLNIAQLPITLINGQVAFTGSKVGEHEIRLIVEGILRY
jgi:hypothetical protein